jgi:competence ComEA-like helix-hairpin-helix protein
MRIRTEKQQIFAAGVPGRPGLRVVERIAVIIAAAVTIVTAAHCIRENAQQSTFFLQTEEQTSAAGEKLDLNTATEEELEDLPGIGPVLAGRIVAWREKNGGFSSQENVMDVDGIGPSIWEGIEPFVTY